MSDTKCDYMHGFQQNFAAVPASLPTIRHQLDQLLDHQASSLRRRGDIRLAVSEACANAVRHAYPDAEGKGGTVCITAEVSTDALLVTVRDYGGGLITPQPGSGGFGLVLLHRLADTVIISPADPGVAMRMTFLL